jgi:hypothetical protein
MWEIVRKVYIRSNANFPFSYENTSENMCDE